MAMDIKRALKDIRKKYSFKSMAPHESVECAELAFIAMLDHFFKGAAGTGALFSKKKLEILDIGCSTMPYALPLKVFFERFRQNREVNILGIDMGIGAAFARIDIEKSGIKGITIKRKRLQQLENGGFDIVTCFNFHTRDAAGFFTKASELLDKDGLLLLSFDRKEEFRSEEQAVLDAGFEVIHKEENPFQQTMSAFFFNNRLLCAARKKKR